MPMAFSPHSANFGFRGGYVGTFTSIWTNTPRYGLPDRFRGSADGQGFAQWFRKMYTATKYHEPSRDFGNTYCGFSKHLGSVKCLIQPQIHCEERGNCALSPLSTKVKSSKLSKSQWIFDRLE